MSPNYYNTLLQGLSMLNAVAASAQNFKDNPEEVRKRANTVNDVAQIFQNANSEEFSPENWQQFHQHSLQLGETAQLLAEECQKPTAVMQLTGGNLKTLLLQLGDILKNERPEIRGKSFWEKMKERFGKS